MKSFCNLFKIVFVAVLLVLLTSCGRFDRSAEVKVIPEPQEVSLLGGYSDATDCIVKDEVDSTLENEEYKICIKKGFISVTASSKRGFLYADQTLRQLKGDDGLYPNVEIHDWPRFSYRGLHLDCSRHFFSISEVKKILSLMALHKLNVLHWHLTDDQGWRIEIDSWPRLTEVGALRIGGRLGRPGTKIGPDDKLYGGFYSKKELRNVVEYADSLGIDIMPEIDLPGHMLSALASYPELGCTGGPYQVSNYGGISQDVLCAGNEKTYKFIEDVLTEVIDLFPYKYIHLGGDECPKDRWHSCPKCQEKIKELGIKADSTHSAEQLLQGYVTERVGNFLAGQGRRLVGWDEILEGNAPLDAVVMPWRGTEGGIKASALGHDVIMTPNMYMYLDYCQSENKESEPDGIGGYIPVWKVYEYEPYTPDMTTEQKSHILGVQANLWTEFISDNSHLEYMLLPRLSALSEVQWCEPDRKSFDRFMKDISCMTRLYEKSGCNYAKHVFGVIGQHSSSSEGVKFTLHTAGDAQIYYTLDGSVPTEEALTYKSPFIVSEQPVTVKAAVYRDGKMSDVYCKDILANKAYCKPVTVSTEKAWNYKWQPNTALVDGLRGGTNFNTDSFVAWNEEPMDVTINMGSNAPAYSSVSLYILVDKLNYIFAPSSIEVSLSDDGENFITAATLNIPTDSPDAPDGLRMIPVNFEEAHSRYIRIKAPVLFPIPDWHPGHGHHAFIFVDEIAVN